MCLSHNLFSQATSLIFIIKSWRQAYPKAGDVFLPEHTKPGYFWPFAIFPRTSFNRLFCPGLPNNKLKYTFSSQVVCCSQDLDMNIINSIIFVTLIFFKRKLYQINNQLIHIKMLTIFKIVLISSRNEYQLG